jgi:hypothetical protein
MNRWFKSIFAGLAMTGLVFLFYKKILSRNQPGLYNVHYVLGIAMPPPEGNNIKNDIPGELPAFIKKRISELGYTSIIRVTNNNNLDILVENVSDTFSLRQAVTPTNKANKLEFREVYTLDELPSFFTAADEVSGRVFDSAKRKEVGIYSIISPLAPDEIDGRNIFRSALGLVNKKDTAILSRILHQAAVVHSLPPDLQFYYGILTDASVIRNSPDDLYLYAIRTRFEKAIIQNNDIESAEIPDYRPGIYLRLNKAGIHKWSDMISKNMGRYIALILDDIVTDATKIFDTRPGSGILLNDGGFTMAEAAMLVSQLNSGLGANGLAIIKEEISSKNKGGRINLIVLLSLTFAITTGLALLIFNNLKNR